MANTGTEGQAPKEKDIDDTEELQSKAEAEAEANALTGEQREAAANEAVTGGLWDGIPEDHPVRTEVANAREEAGKYRTKLREIEEQFKDAKTPEEYAAVTRDLNKANVAREFNLSDDVLEFLTGDSPEALKVQGEKLSKLGAPAEPAPEPVTKVVTQTTPAGGLTPTTSPAPDDGRSEWKKHKGRR